MNETYHPDCQECCAARRCHFCLEAGQLIAHYDHHGELLAVRLCRAHYAWALSDKRAPPSILFDGVYRDREEPLPESVRQGETYHNAVLASLMT